MKTRHVNMQNENYHAFMSDSLCFMFLCYVLCVRLKQSKVKSNPNHLCDEIFSKHIKKHHKSSWFRERMNEKTMKLDPNCICVLLFIAFFLCVHCLLDPV